MIKSYHAVQMFQKIIRNIYNTKFIDIQSHAVWGKLDHVNFLSHDLQCQEHVPSVLEPFSCDDEDVQEKGKILWISVKKQLNNYGLGSYIVHTC